MVKRLRSLICIMFAAVMCFGTMAVYAEEETAASAGWQKDDVGFWYRNADGSYPMSTWDYIDGSWYHFDGVGYMQTGWLWAGGWFYLSSDGHMVTGWVKEGNNWYFLDGSGVMRTGWLWDNAWYYLHPNGQMAVGWINDGSGWYYLNSSGAMQTGWINDNGKWYYLYPNGQMAVGWINDGGGWYYLNGSGAMQTGWIFDGSSWYYLSNSGAMLTGWLKDKDIWYYMDGSGRMHTGWLKYNGQMYYLNPDGSMATGKQVIDGKEYTFENNGVCDTPVEPDYDGVTLTKEIADFARNLVASVTTGEMTPAEKLWAAFITVADRSIFPYSQDRIPPYRGYDWPVVYTQDMMNGGSDCHGNAALFGYTAMVCGYDNIHWVHNGGHAWVDIDGLLYDPVFLNSTRHTEVFAWTYEQAIANRGYLGAGYQYPPAEGTYQFIKVPQF